VRKTVQIWTDGACSGNPGAGAWCAILEYKGKQKIISGFESNTTNNRMEIMAVIQALKTLKEPCDVILYTDSQYVVNMFEHGWINNWLKNNWKLSSGERVKNIDLLEKLIELIKNHKVKFVKIKGHSDNPLNNKCDQIARQLIKKMVEKQP